MNYWICMYENCQKYTLENVELVLYGHTDDSYN